MAMAEGLQKYGPWNGLTPAEESLEHAFDHIEAYFKGDRSEDHLGHAAARLLMACQAEESGL